MSVTPPKVPLVRALLIKQLEKLAFLAQASQLSQWAEAPGIKSYAAWVEQVLLESHPALMAQMTWLIEHQQFREGSSGKVPFFTTAPWGVESTEEGALGDEEEVLPFLSGGAFFKGLEAVLNPIRQRYVRDMRDKAIGRGKPFHPEGLVSQLRCTEAKVVCALFAKSMMAWIDEQVLLTEAVISPQNFSEAILTLTRIAWMSAPFKAYVGEETLARRFEEVNERFKQRLVLFNTRSPVSRQRSMT